MQKTRRSLPKGNSKNTEGVELYAYELTDKNYGETLYIKNSRYGWWLDKGKLMSLIDAYKINCNDIRACFYAGITRRQLEYFIQQHPEFVDFREQMKASLGVIAQDTFSKEIMKNPAAAAAYLKQEEENERRREEYAKKKEREEEGEPANEIVFVDFSDPANALPAGKENDDAKSE